MEALPSCQMRCRCDNFAAMGTYVLVLRDLEAGLSCLIRPHRAVLPRGDCSDSANGGPKGVTLTRKANECARALMCNGARTRIYDPTQRS